MPLVYGEKGYDFVPAERQDPQAFLERYGYTPADMTTWRTAEGESGPKLTIEILRHLEVQGHTWYVINCSLTPRVGQPNSDQAAATEEPQVATAPPTDAAREDGTRSGSQGRLEWRVKRRMRHLRQGLHDPAKELCGRLYWQFFQGTRFTFHTSWPGTTDRLNNWLGLLASGINSRAVAPGLAALTLHFLEPPAPGAEAPDPDETDYSDLARLAAAARAESEPADAEDGRASRMTTVSFDSESSKSSTYSRWYWWLMPVPT
mmetsp:Transcript_62194/g.192782  ORF Transcript_62194/g.192782 Transcript_62194/m.192782 type:complete len:261 (-) Transcript_62194:78-860(-)